jgi:hypothetical protein
MQTRDMTIGDLIYRLVQGRDPPWNDDTRSDGGPVTHRPEKLIEWLHAWNPLQVRFCGCGLLQEVRWSRGYITRHLYPKGPTFYASLCPSCGELAAMRAHKPLNGSSGLGADV